MGVTLRKKNMMILTKIEKLTGVINCSFIKLIRFFSAWAWKNEITALDKDWTILDESLENVAKVSKQLEIENGELFMAGYSARYILEELNNEPGMWQMAKLTGLPMGVIVSAFENIFAGQSSENV